MSDSSNEWFFGFRATLRTIALLIAIGANAMAFADEDGELLFARRIQPLLSEKCLACHGKSLDTIEGGLDLRTLQSTQAGGDTNAPLIVLGDAPASPLFQAVSRSSNQWSAMPPKESEQLTPEELGWVKEWINSGAQWPAEDRIAELQKANEAKWAEEDGTALVTSGGLSPQWTNRRYKPGSLWAYQPVQKPTLPHKIEKPQIDFTSSAAIDQLLDMRRPHGLVVAPSAEARTLVRRACFGLTGLPPSSELAQQFEASYSRDADKAMAELVDSLLESPHYGERMAQHWLDVARYADSSGFANDYQRGSAWRYRDYVIRSFNNDKGFDQFIREQIAGDEIDAKDPEKLVATGFLRMGPWELTGMEVAKIARQRFLDDVTNSVGETFLAHSLQCARCHDHKFDPVPTRDYYSIQAAFASTQLCERSAPFLETENTSGFEERQYLEMAVSEHQQTLVELDELLLANAQKWFQENQKDSKKWNEAVQAARAGSNPRKAMVNNSFSEVFSRARTILARQGEPESEYPPKLLGFTPEQFGRERVARKGLERLRWDLDRYEPVALAVFNGKTPKVTSVTSPTRRPDDPMAQGELEESYILAGGDPFSPTERVKPGSLSVLDKLCPISVTEAVSGRRTELANWIANRNNPLTSRVIVNRIWMWHFGQPIAGNPNNFGSTGKPPTHPELLDWLAAELVEKNWSIKSLHRTIMLSQAYRRSSHHPQPDQLKELDPLGISYSAFQPRRLSAEELRDSMLAVSGELNLAIGGIPVRPEINPEVAMQPRQVMGTFAEAWVPNPLPSQRHRRSIYVLKLRGLSDPAMEVFNAPSPDFACERRDLSVVTPQVFSLFNSQNAYYRALALAVRALKESSEDIQAVQRCFQLCYGRKAGSEELQKCLEHWQDMTQIQSSVHSTNPEPLLSILREAVEENTGERFSFEEKLFANRDFVADLQAADFDAKTRALSDLCLVLLNSSEFSYVY